LKRAAAERAVVDYVESGMVLGLGTGSTAAFVVRRGVDLARELGDDRGVAASKRTAALAEEVGVPLVTLADARPEVTIDGADEIGPGLALIKGGGGSLLREKIVAHATEPRGGMIVVADGSKLVDSLGEHPLPVEVEPFGWEVTLQDLASLGCEPELRMDRTKKNPFVTIGDHYTADCRFASIPDPVGLEREVKGIPGALECGLFVGLARVAVVSRPGETRVIEAKPR